MDTRDISIPDLYELPTVDRNGPQRACGEGRVFTHLIDRSIPLRDVLYISGNTRCLICVI